LIKKYTNLDLNKTANYNNITIGNFMLIQIYQTVSEALLTYDSKKGVLRKIFGDQKDITRLRALEENSKTNLNQAMFYELCEILFNNEVKEGDASYEVMQFIIDSNKIFQPIKQANEILVNYNVRTAKNFRFICEHNALAIDIAWLMGLLYNDGIYIKDNQLEKLVENGLHLVKELVAFILGLANKFRIKLNDKDFESILSAGKNLPLIKRFFLLDIGRCAYLVDIDLCRYMSQESAGRRLVHEIISILCIYPDMVTEDIILFVQVLDKNSAFNDKEIISILLRTQGKKISLIARAATSLSSKGIIITDEILEVLGYKNGEHAMSTASILKRLPLDAELKTMLFEANWNFCHPAALSLFFLRISGFNFNKKSLKLISQTSCNYLSNIATGMENLMENLPESREIKFENLALICLEDGKYAIEIAKLIVTLFQKPSLSQVSVENLIKCFSGKYAKVFCDFAQQDLTEDDFNYLIEISKLPDHELLALSPADLIKVENMFSADIDNDFIDYLTGLVAQDRGYWDEAERYFLKIKAGLWFERASLHLHELAIPQYNEQDNPKKFNDRIRYAGLAGPLGQGYLSLFRAYPKDMARFKKDIDKQMASTLECVTKVLEEIEIERKAQTILIS